MKMSLFQIKKKQILIKEQYYLDLLKPEYNLNKIAGSNLGRKYSLIVRKKMSLAKLGKPSNKKGAILSEETKLKFRERSGKAKAIVMLNNKNEIIAKFLSIQIASEITGISRNSISRCARGIKKFIIKNGLSYRFEYQETNK
jgi:NUMOD3 motif-containing protein